MPNTPPDTLTTGRRAQAVFDALQAIQQEALNLELTQVRSGAADGDPYPGGPVVDGTQQTYKEAQAALQNAEKAIQSKYPALMDRVKELADQRAADEDASLEARRGASAPAPPATA